MTSDDVFVQHNATCRTELEFKHKRKGRGKDMNSLSGSELTPKQEFTQNDAKNRNQEKDKRWRCSVKGVR